MENLSNLDNKSKNVYKRYKNVWKVGQGWLIFIFIHQNI